MLNDKQRAALTAEALSWCAAKTPYRGWACIKGAGTDCGQLLYGVYRACGLLPALELPKDYSLDVAAHRASTEYMDFVCKFFRVIPESEAKPGDIVCYKLGLAMAHAAIVISWPDFIIQAELRHGVSGSHGLCPALRERRYLHGTVREFCTLRDEFCKGGF
jgi:hypothetical protein